MTEDAEAITGPSMLVKRFLTFAVGVAILLALAAALSACGGGMMGDGMGGGMMDESMGSMHGGGSREPQTPVVSDASQVTVEISNLDFFPRDLTVQAGSSVTWVNRDAVPHDATDAAGAWGTGTLAPGESATLTFESFGSYEYACTIHPNMAATLTVT